MPYQINLGDNVEVVKRNTVQLILPAKPFKLEGPFECSNTISLDNEGFHQEFHCENQEFYMIGDNDGSDFMIVSCTNCHTQYVVQEKIEHVVEMEVFGEPSEGTSNAV